MIAFNLLSKSQVIDMETVTPYLADGILILVFLLVVLRAWRIGFARSMAGIIAWIAAAVLAMRFCVPVAQAVYTRFLQERVTALAVQEIQDRTGAVETIDVTVDLLHRIPESAVRAAQSAGVDVDSLEKQMQAVVPATDDLAQQIERQVLAPVIIAALKIVVFLVILIAASAIVQAVLSPVGSALHKMPVIGTADRTLGGVLGILKGAVAVTVLAIVAKVLGGVLEGEFGQVAAQSKIIPFIESSPIAGAFFQT